jgi:hypothetical protein
MPLTWTLDSSQHFVLMSAEGEVTRADVEAYLSEIERAKAMGWRKLLDLRGARLALGADDIEAIGVRLREADAAGEVGPLAVVLPDVDPEGIMRMLGFLAAAKRPMRIFQAIEPARRWIRRTRRARAKRRPRAVNAG